MTLGSVAIFENGGGLSAELGREPAGQDVQALNRGRDHDRTLTPGKRIRERNAVHHERNIGVLAPDMLLPVGVGRDPGLPLCQRARIAAPVYS